MPIILCIEFYSYNYRPTHFYSYDGPGVEPTAVIRRPSYDGAGLTPDPLFSDDKRGSGADPLSRRPRDGADPLFFTSDNNNVVNAEKMH